MSNVNTLTVINSVAEVWSDKGITTFRAGCEVIAIAHELGYPRPLQTGIWANDVSALFRLFAARMRTGRETA